MKIDIKRLRATDAGLFSRIAPDVFDAPINAERLTAYLAEPNHFMVVALRDEEIVGQCAAVLHRHPDKPTELYIDEVGVTPSLWRRGIARRLLDEMFAWGRERGCEESWVGTENDNAAARALYEKFGAEGEAFVMYLYEL